MGLVSTLRDPALFPLHLMTKPRILD